MSQDVAKKLRFAILATDVALFSLKDDELVVRLINVNRPPHFVNVPGLPGGLLLPTETAEETTLRQIKTKAAINTKKVYVDQLATFSSLDRDPRGRIVAVAYLGLVPWQSLSVVEQQGNEEVYWQPVKNVRKLAYDHNLILKTAITRLQKKVTYSTVIQKLLPKEFTLSELEQAYEDILGDDLDKRNFRRKLKQINIVEPTGKKREGEKHRPAMLYKFISSAVTQIEII